MSQGNQRDYMREYMRKRRAKRDDGVSVREFERQNKIDRERNRKLKYWREIQIRWRAAHPGYHTKYCKEWRARKKRQAEVIARVWDQVDRFEYGLRCAAVSREVREMRQ
jgi:hypothetical protein